jgi:protein TonB
VINIQQPHRGGLSQTHIGEQSHASELRDVAARWRAPDVATSGGAANVVIFRNVRRDGGPIHAAPEIPAPAKLTLAVTDPHRLLRWAALLTFSVAAHLAFVVPFQHEPPPMASVGEISVSVELVLGANQDAGLVPDGGIADASTPPPAQAPVVVDEIKPIEKPPEKPPEEKPVQKAEPVEKQAPPPQVAQLEPTEKPPVPAQVQAVALAEVSDALRASPNPEVPNEIKPLEQPPEIKKLEEVTAREPPPSAVKGERNELQTRTAASTAAGGVGRGSSDADSNYRGRIAAHLSRHKRFPAEARNRGASGSASVTFSIDGSGRVTSVKLVQGSGVPSLDHEATAMVQRASPFPAPPSGRGLTFTVPVSFRLK